MNQALRLHPEQELMCLIITGTTSDEVHFTGTTNAFVLNAFWCPDHGRRAIYVYPVAEVL